MARVSAERIFCSHFPKATVERQRNQFRGGYYLVRKASNAYMPCGEGGTKSAAWRDACDRVGLTELYAGLCPRGRHGLDWPGQSCDLCAKERP